MRLNIRKIDDSHRVVVGTVTKMRQGTGDAEGRVVNLTLEGTEWDGEKEVKTSIDIPFWNSEDADKPQRADWVAKAKVREGSVIAVELYKPEGSDKEMGNRFMYGGCWNYPQNEDHNEITILMGVAANPKVGMAGESKITRIGIPVSRRDSGDSEWYNVTFWNNEGRMLADAAEKVLIRKDDKHARVIVSAGAITENDFGKSVTGYGFEVIG